LALSLLTVGGDKRAAHILAHFSPRVSLATEGENIPMQMESRDLRVERRRLAKDTLSAISRVCIDNKFVGHDGREYMIARGSEKAETKNVVEVTVKIAGVDKPLARYALILIEISGQ
jgi:hypothetical protein